MARRRKSVKDITAQLARINKLNIDLGRRNAMRAGNAFKTTDDYLERSQQLQERGKSAMRVANKYRDNIYAKTGDMDTKVSYSTRAGIKG